MAPVRALLCEGLSGRSVREEGGMAGVRVQVPVGLLWRG